MALFSILQKHLVKTSVLASVLIAATISTELKAEPWVDTSNIFLRVNIQHLFDKGYIKTPVTTFPLMWHDISRDLKKIKHSQLSTSEKDAYFYVNQQLKLANKSLKTVELNAAASEKRFSSFGDGFRDNNSIQIHTSFMNDWFAAKISPSYNSSPDDGDDVSFNDSYLAAYMGNWVVSLGMQDRWWGPGWDTSLSMSNNARPMPALALTRMSAVPVGIPFTEIEIPWTVTTFMGWMDDERVIEDTLLWGFRFNFLPMDNLEVSISRLAQWSGENRPSEFDTFIDLLAGKDNCGGNGPTVEECAAGEEPGNQLAGFDLRYTSNIFDQPLSFSVQMMAEDGNSKNNDLVAQKVWGYGIETYVDLFDHNWLTYLEYADSFTDCTPTRAGGKNGIGDCLYEHHTYQTGMRYKGRVLGNIYENDAESFVFGLVSQGNSDTNYEFKLRYLKLNYDNHDKAPSNPLIGNTLTAIAEDMLMLSGKVQHSHKNWRYTFGADISESSFEEAIRDDSEINVYLTIEYNL
jgi:hypothetical protein